jgi:hypothetical protein
MASSTVDSEDASGSTHSASPPQNEVVTDTSGVMLLEYIPITQRASSQISKPAIRDPALRIPQQPPLQQPQTQPQQQQTPATHTKRIPKYTPHTRLSGIAEDEDDTVSETSIRSRVLHKPPVKHGRELKSVEVLSEERFQRIFDPNYLNFAKLPDITSSVRFTPTSLDGTNEDKLVVEDRSELSAIRSFTEIREMMNTKFVYKEGRLSSTLDILSQYMRGQKILYLEAKSYCEFYLYRLMIPTIFISTACSVVGGLFAESPIISIAVAAANGFNTLLLALINYFKLDARAEAHRMTAYGFDQLISECEFTSGKILLSNIVTDPEVDKDAHKYNLKYVQDFMTSLEGKVKDIKQKNQFIIPDSIRHRYPNIYYTNVFALVFQSQIQEMIITNQLKLACNAFAEVENQIIKGDRRPHIYEDYNHKLKQKNELIEEILKHRQEALLFDQQIREEVSYNQRRCCTMLRCYY